MSHFCTVINASTFNRGYFTFGKSTGVNGYIFDLIKLGVVCNDFSGIVDVLLREKNGWEGYNANALGRLLRWVKSGNLEDFQCYCDADGEEPWYRDVVPTWYPSKGDLWTDHTTDMSGNLALDTWGCCGYISTPNGFSDPVLRGGRTTPDGLIAVQKYLKSHPTLWVINLPKGN